MFPDTSYVKVNDKMPGQEDMDLCTDKLLSKSRILQELTKAVKLVYAQSLHGTVVLDGNCWLVYWLDCALRHGLRVERHGYWGIIRDLSHQDTIVVIHALQSVLTSIGKGRAWLYHTLSEGSFESYLACFLRDNLTLGKQYFSHALVRDCDKTHQLINLLAGLENVSFTLQLDVTYLDICNYMPQRPMSGSPSGTALSLHLRSSSNASSLASPGDSGVVLDSDMDISNETDGSSYNEEDSSTHNFSQHHNVTYESTLNNGQDSKNLSPLTSSSGSSPNTKMLIQSAPLRPNSQSCKITTSDISNKNIVAIDSDDNDSNCRNLAILTENNPYSESLNELKSHKVDNQLGNTRENYINRGSYYADGGYNFRKNIDSRSNSYIINNDTNLLELSMIISDCDCSAETPYSILNTVNMSDTSILSSSGSGNIQRRHRKKKRNENKKRVSFHEDIFKTMKLEDDENFTDLSMSFVSPDYPPKKDTETSRYNWCRHGDSQNIEKLVNEKNAQSYHYALPTSNNIFGGDVHCNTLSNKSCEQPSLLERGVPEGQEDPSKNLKSKMEIELAVNEAQEAYIVERKYGYIMDDAPAKDQMPPPNHPNQCISSSTWPEVDSMTTTVDVDDRKNPARHLASPVKKRNITTIPLAKTSDTQRSLASSSALVVATVACRQGQLNTSLLSRFLRSITERKYYPGLSNKNKNMTSGSLFIKGVKDVNYNLFKDFNDDLEREIQENIVAEKCEFSGEKISLKLREIFKRQIYRDKTEELYKVYKVRSSYMNNCESRAMLALLTDKTLYLTGSKSNNSYRNQFVIPYSELNVIIVGPNAQTILISNADHEMQYLFSTGSSQTTSELIAHLEMAMRRSSAKPKLPAVRELNYIDMKNLKYSLLSQTPVNMEEKIEYYSIIYIEDDHISPPSTPCGLIKEGDLMFRYHSYQRQSVYPNTPINPWEAGYFVLKGGVVYIFTDSSQRLPKRAIPLRGGLCHGCRRIPNSHRPHTFEILLESNQSFQFAAPDEYVASEWLQSIVQSASGLFDIREKKTPLPCSLVITTKHLITMKEVFSGDQRGQTLSCAAVADLTAFRVPLAQQSWCILEFACREVLESSGDWVVHFTNYTELCSFREVLETLWANMKMGEFPMAILSSDNKLHRRCSDVNKDLEHAWEHLLPISAE